MIGTAFVIVRIAEQTMDKKCISDIARPCISVVEGN